MIKSMSGSIRRLPRPNGATALAAEAYISGEPSIKKSFIDFMINHWLLSNGNICNVQYDIYSLAKALNIQVEEIRLKMRDNLITSRIWDKDNQEKVLFGMMGELISWTLEDRMRINSQIDILTKSQKGKYTPFISAELNKALKLGLDSGASLQGVLSKFMGGGTTNIFNMFQQNNDNSVNNTYVTTTEVLEMISEQATLDKPEQAKLLETRYDLQALPEVVATRQEGVDISKEGLGGNINVTELNQITDNLKGARLVAEDDHHAMRREIEMNIDPDEDDPEIDIYDEYVEDTQDNFSISNYLNK